MFHGNLPLDIAEGLRTLRSRIEAAAIPPSKLDETLNVATWNVREFGTKRRSAAAIHYIAEVIGQFDLVGLVELNENLQDLQRILPILGPYWDVVYSDAIREPSTNLARDKRYDQILHFARFDESFTDKGGVLDFYKGDHKPLFPDLTKDQFTYQMSDHLPLWIQINTDIDGAQLDQLIQRKRG